MVFQALLMVLLLSGKDTGITLWNNGVSSPAFLKTQAHLITQ